MFSTNDINVFTQILVLESLQHLKSSQYTYWVRSQWEPITATGFRCICWSYESCDSKLGWLKHGHIIHLQLKDYMLSIYESLISRNRAVNLKGMVKNKSYQNIELHLQMFDFAHLPLVCIAVAINKYVAKPWNMVWIWFYSSRSIFNITDIFLWSEFLSRRHFINAWFCVS